MLKIIERNSVNSDCAASYQINIERDGKRIAGFSAYPLYECPEDASLERDMSFAYDAVKFFRLGYDAGKNGEEVTFEEAPKEE